MESGNMHSTRDIHYLYSPVRPNACNIHISAAVTALNLKKVELLILSVNVKQTRMLVQLPELTQARQHMLTFAIIRSLLNLRGRCENGFYWPSSSCLLRKCGSRLRQALPAGSCRTTHAVGC
jgi:hypothetical protein